MGPFSNLNTKVEHSRNAYKIDGSFSEIMFNFLFFTLKFSQRAKAVALKSDSCAHPNLRSWVQSQVKDILFAESCISLQVFM